MKETLQERRGVLMLFLVVAVLIFLSLSAQFIFGSSSDGSLVYRLADWYRALGMFGILVSTGVMIASALTFLPAEVPAIANGAVYGVAQGALLSWASGMCGANIAFAIGRWGGNRVLDYFLNHDQLERVENWNHKRGGISLLIARCIPLFPFFVLNFGAGIVGMRWWTFNWATGLGMLPATFGFAILGNQMGNLTFTQAALVVSIALVLICFAAYIVRRQQTSRSYKA